MLLNVVDNSLLLAALRMGAPRSLVVGLIVVKSGPRDTQIKDASWSIAVVMNARNIVLVDSPRLLMQAVCAQIAHKERMHSIHVHLAQGVVGQGPEAISHWRQCRLDDVGAQPTTVKLVLGRVIKQQNVLAIGEGAPSMGLLHKLALSLLQCRSLCCVDALAEFGGLEQDDALERVSKGRRRNSESVREWCCRLKSEESLEWADSRCGIYGRVEDELDAREQLQPRGLFA